MPGALSILKRLVLGNTDLPEQCIVAMPDPQDEVRGWLHSSAGVVDVTGIHMMACPSPFTIGIGFGGIGNGGIEIDNPPESDCHLEFRERAGDERLLASIGLRFSRALQTSGPTLALYDVRDTHNYCLPRHRLWSHYLHKAWLRHRERNRASDVPMTARGAHAMMAFFICPRPVVLVSVGRYDIGNIFPMNIMGPISPAHFAFALNSSRRAAPLVESAGHLAISSIPIEQAAFVRTLGKNHRQEMTPWRQFPFANATSPAFGLPVPGFALRVRELEIENVTALGSHTLFTARVIHDERRSGGPQFCMIHGVYEAWRRRQAARRR